jgi:hypothetical protein
MFYAALRLADILSKELIMTPEQEIKAKSLELAIEIFRILPQTEKSDGLDKAWIYIEPMANIFFSYIKGDH